MCHVGLDVLPVAHSFSPLCTGRDHFGKFGSPLSVAALVRMLLFAAWSSGQPAPVALSQPVYRPQSNIAPTPPVLAILKSICAIVAFPKITFSARSVYLLFFLVASFAHLHLSEASDNRNTSTTLDYEPVYHHRSLERVFESGTTSDDNNSADAVAADIVSNIARMPSVYQGPLASRNVLNQSSLIGNGTRLVDRFWPHGNMSALDFWDGSHWRSLATAAAQPDNLPLLPLITISPNITSSNVSAVLTPAIAATTSWPHLSTNLTKLVANMSAYVTHPQASIVTAVRSHNNLTEVPNSTAFFNIATDSQSSSTTIVLEPDLRIHHPLLAVLLGLICVVVVFGNVLTMVAIYRERYLHTVTNYFVASLAAADCLVGAVVMPFSVVHEVMNKWWIFGQDWCDLWHSFDVLASSASILNLCVISLDRYWAITDPITYPSRMTPTKAALFIFGVWFSSAIISFPAIVWWRAVQKEPAAPYRCVFTDDVGYLVFSSTISFYGPLTVMVFTYYRIYVIASQQTRSLKLGVKQIEMSSVTDGGSGTSSECPPSGFALRMHRGGYSGAATHKQNGNINYHSVSHDKLSSLSKSESYDIKASMDHLPNSSDYGEYDGNGNCERSHLDGTSQASRQFRNHKANWSVGRRLAKLAKERKAAKTLGIVMGVFIISWLPFFATNVGYPILMGICPIKCAFKWELVFSIVTWLGWMNSAMNPFIYACWSKDFRRAFRKILCSCCISSSNLSYDRNRIYKAPHNRHNNYYYKSKVKRDPNADFNFNTPKSTKTNHCTKSNAKLKTVHEHEASHSSQPLSNGGTSANPSQLTSPVNPQMASNGNCDTSKNKGSNELPLANNVLHMANSNK